MSDLFAEKYNEVITPIASELARFDEIFVSYFSKINHPNNEIVPIIQEFLLRKSKRLRPVIIFLVTKALGQDVTDFHYNIALANEIIHNATLIHDDIIDCALVRRGEKTLNFNYDSKLAVLAGDYLLAEVLKIINEIDSYEIRKIHNEAVSSLIRGELFQYFNRFKLLSLDCYIEKSMNKTARLFEAGVVSAFLNSSSDKIQCEQVRDFALNFGVAFQIHNDLKNILKPDKISEDINNGDYSAPLIFYAQEKYGKDVQKLENLDFVIKNISKTTAIEKTKDLMNKYIHKAIENTSFIEDNLFKQSLISLCKLFIEL